MNTAVFQNIFNIIERDSKTSTYKFALLRGTIDIIQENSQFIQRTPDGVQIPLGLLINKWIFYYYPLFSSDIEIVQITSRKGIAFRNELIAVINYYDNEKGGMSVLYQDLRLGKYPSAVKPAIMQLYAKLKTTIVNMPMKYIGQSINKKHNSIYTYTGTSSRDKSDLIHGYGTFTIPFDYYEAFKLFGSFISGKESIINKWAEFSYNLNYNSDKRISTIIDRLIEEPVKERDVSLALSIYKQQPAIYCVWSGKKLEKYDVDHVIPFSIWKNNDLWNLLPSTPSVNNNKRDKIPTPETIEKAKDRIIAYWEILIKQKDHRFAKEMEIALLGKPLQAGWQQEAIDQLKRKTYYLINQRGYEPWSI